MKTKVNTRSMVLMGFLAALTAVFSFTPIGSVPIGPLVITLNIIPVALAAIACGPIGGAVMGAVFGTLSFLQCIGIGIPSGMGAILFEISPFLAFVQRFVPRVLDGFLLGFIFRFISKRTSPYISCFVTGLLSAILNTAFFMTALIALFGKTDYVQGLMDEKSTHNVFLFICMFVGVNALCEMAASSVVSGAVGSALFKAKLIDMPSGNK